MTNHSCALVISRIGLRHSPAPVGDFFVQVFDPNIERVAETFLLVQDDFRHTFGGGFKQFRIGRAHHFANCVD